MKVAAPNEILVVTIMERMGWTYQDYMVQPQWLIDTLMLKWSLDAEAQNKK